jgi:hypothetical protein
LEGYAVIIDLPCDPNFGGDFGFFRRSDNAFLSEFAPIDSGDNGLMKAIDVGSALADGDYYITTSNPNSLFCCRIENQVAQIADFWPQLDMLRAMQAGKAYNWTNQANEVLRVAIEEAS